MGTCQCPLGYEGGLCEIDVDDCSANPCQNGGVCVDGLNSYQCECAAGFTGNHCESDINDCADDPCFNGGKCIDGVNSYVCECLSDYTGDNCEIKITTTTTTQVPTEDWTESSSTEEGDIHHHHHHHHYHHHHHGHFYVQPCNGGNFQLMMLLKQKAKCAWLKHLFEKKDHEKWLANSLEKGEIDDKQHEFIQDLLEKRDQSESDRTSQWWKNPRSSLQCSSR